MADDNNEVASLVSLLSRFERTSEYPETYLKPPSSLEKDTKATVKDIFDFCKKDEPNSSRSLASTCPLQELLVDDFDIEQIWQEIELQNTPLLHLGKKDIQIIKQEAEKISLCLAYARSKDLVEGNQLVDMQSETISDNINGFVEHGNESDSDDYSSGKESGLENSDEETDNNYDKNTNDRKEVNTTSKQKGKQKPSAKKSQVDDKFFKLSDMLQFLDKEDRKFERAHKKKNQTENDDEDDSDENESELVDYFVDIGGSDMEDEEDDNWNKALDATGRLLGRCISTHRWTFFKAITLNTKTWLLLNPFTCNR